MVKILVIEDDVKLNKLFCTVLSRHGYQTASALDSSEALEVLDNQHIDLIVSDIMMPGMDGLELSQLLRDTNFNMPILVISAKEDFEDKQKGFQIGIDDYMVKPIDVNEMILRVGALLRRAKIVSDRKIQIGNTIVDNDSLTVTFENQEILLPQKEFQILYKLISYPNRIFTRQQLMDEIWGYDTDSDERTVDVHINRLRSRIKNSNDFEIVTIRGLGYKAVKH